MEIKTTDGKKIKVSYIGNVKIIIEWVSIYIDKNKNFYTYAYNGLYKKSNWINKDEIFNSLGYVYK